MVLKIVTFAKAQIASLIASIIDYWCTIIAVELVGIWYVWASAIGTVVGGITNFSLGRNWVFKRREKARNAQMVRYIIVWTGYLILTTSGVFLPNTLYAFELCCFKNNSFIGSGCIVQLSFTEKICFQIE